jgi:hypothetical protein
MKLISGAKYAALRTLCDRLIREAEKRDAERLATITRLRAQLDQQRDVKPTSPVQQPEPILGDAELHRRLNLALRANRELNERLGQMQDTHIADTRELHDLRQKGES